MLLVIDIGNSRIKIGLFNEDQLLIHFSCASSFYKTADEYGLFLLQMLSYHKINPLVITKTIMSSVVPTLNNRIESAISNYLNLTVIKVTTDLSSAIRIKCNSKELGTDRFVKAVAAVEMYGGPIIIIDFGTATTFCSVSKDRYYLGGLICPGVAMCADALAERTALLPRVDIIKPDKAIATDTITNIQAGIFYGYLGQVSYIVRKIKSELGNRNIKVVATGGFAELICSEKELVEVDKINKFLLFEGLRIIAEEIK